MMLPALRLATLKKGAAWMLIYGEQDSAQTADARRVYRQLERFHPEPESGQAAPSGLAEVRLPSSLGGSGLMSQSGEPIEQSIINFLTTQVASQDLPWTKRRNRLQ